MPAIIAGVRRLHLDSCFFESIASPRQHRLGVPQELIEHRAIGLRLPNVARRSMRPKPMRWLPFLARPRIHKLIDEHNQIARRLVRVEPHRRHIFIFKKRHILQCGQHFLNVKRMWDNIKQVMAPGALDPLTKELIYIAVSITNNCNYCIAAHTASARAKGMTDEQLAELLAVTGLANETNRLAIGYNVPYPRRTSIWLLRENREAMCWRKKRVLPAFLVACLCSRSQGNPVANVGLN
jgi:AhpD family alkylhydroperoxidase